MPQTYLFCIFYQTTAPYAVKGSIGLRWEGVPAHQLSSLCLPPSLTGSRGAWGGALTSECGLPLGQILLPAGFLGVDKSLGGNAFPQHQGLTAVFLALARSVVMCRWSLPEGVKVLAQSLLENGICAWVKAATRAAWSRPLREGAVRRRNL